MDIQTLPKALIKLHNHCNNRCLYCHSSDLSYPSLSLEETLSKIQAAKDLGVRMILFSGGEPTLHPDLLKISKMMYHLSLPFGLITNSRKLSQDRYLSKLLDNGLKYIYTSLSAASPELHNRIAGATKAFEETIQGIASIISHKPSIDFFLINVVIIKQNLNQMEAIDDFLQSKGVKKIKFSLAEIKGEIALHKENAADPGLFAHNLVSLLSQKKSAPYIYYDGIPPCLLPSEERRNWHTKHVHNFFTDHILYSSEGYEKEFYPTSLSYREYFSVCDQCRIKKQCEGIYRGYQDLFPLSPIPL